MELDRYIGKRFSQSTSTNDSSSTHYRGMLHSWSLNAVDGDPVRPSTGRPVGRSAEQNRDTCPTPRFARRPSTRNSLFPAEGAYPQNYMVDQQKVQISELHFDKFPTPSTFSCWKIRNKTQVSPCSSSSSDAMLWIKEVEMVDSLDELKSSRPIPGNNFPNFERIASALNKIIHNSHFKKNFSLEEQKAQKEDQFLRGRQIAYLIYEYFRVTGANDSVENYAGLFTVVLRNDDAQEFDTRWDETRLSMTRIPPDDVLESLYKLGIRESEQHKTVLELYEMETHQNISMPDYQKLRTMVKRSIDQKLRLRNFDA